MLYCCVSLYSLFEKNRTVRILDFDPYISEEFESCPSDDDGMERKRNVTMPRKNNAKNKSNFSKVVLKPEIKKNREEDKDTGDRSTPDKNNSLGVLNLDQDSNSKRIRNMYDELDGDSEDSTPISKKTKRRKSTNFASTVKNKKTSRVLNFGHLEARNSIESSSLLSRNNNSNHSRKNIETYVTNSKTGGIYDLRSSQAMEEDIMSLRETIRGIKKDLPDCDENRSRGCNPCNLI